MRIYIGTRPLLAKTCVVCGEFKMADEFGRVGKVYWDSYCKSCHNAYTTPIMHEYQEEALDAATKHRTPWGKEDINRLLELRQKGYTAPQIALLMERSVYGIYSMLGRLRKES